MRLAAGAEVTFSTAPAAGERTVSGIFAAAAGGPAGPRRLARRLRPRGGGRRSGTARGPGGRFAQGAFLLWASGPGGQEGPPLRGHGAGAATPGKRRLRAAASPERGLSARPLWDGGCGEPASEGPVRGLPASGVTGRAQALSPEAPRGRRAPPSRVGGLLSAAARDPKAKFKELGAGGTCEMGGGWTALIL